MEQEIQGLKAERVQKELEQLPEWQLTHPDATTIEWQQSFASFNRIVEVMVDIAVFAERYGRTVDVTVEGGALSVRLGMNGLTEADLELAKAISGAC